MYGENRRAVELFLACTTLWRWDGMSGRTLGLDYSGVAALMAMRGERDQRALIDALQTMEAAALPVMNAHLSK